MNVEELKQQGWHKVNVVRHPHRYLTREDQCWFLSSEEFDGNLEGMIDDLRGQFGENARGAAIAAFAREVAVFASCFEQDTRVLLVPMQPSQKKTDADYDDRMEQVCGLAAAVLSNVYAADLLDPRLAEAQLDEGDVVVVVDDILESGAHFKTAQRYLKAVFGAQVTGAFLTRIPPRNEKQRVVVQEDYLEDDIVGATFGQVPKHEKQGMGSRIAGAFGKLFGK